MAVIPIGSGSGALNVSAVGSPGDTLQGVAGTYTSANISNCPGVLIDLTNCIFTGQITLSHIDGTTIQNGKSQSFTGSAFKWNGTFTDVNLLGWTYTDVNGLGHDCNDNVIYNGAAATLKFNRVKFDNFTTTRCGQFMQGAFGTPADNGGFMYQVTISNWTNTQSLSNGTQIKGIFFNFKFFNWTHIYTGNNPVAGDVGFFYGWGCGDMYNIIRHGNRGYIARIWNAGLKTDPVQTSNFYNILDTDSTDYGTVDTRIEAVNMGTYAQGSNFAISYVTAINKGNTINYWSSIVVLGDYPPPFNVFVKNCVGINLTTNGKPIIITNQGTGWVDSPTTNSNNFGAAANNGYLDANYKPLTNTLIGAGVTLSGITLDLAGVIRPNPPAIGAYEPHANIGPVANAGPDQNIATAGTTLNGTASTDPDGSITAYLWSQVSGPGTAAIATPNAATTSVSNLISGSYVFNLKVTDNQSATGNDQITVTVSIPPVPPSNSRKVTKFSTDGVKWIFVYDDGTTSTLP